MDFNWLLVGSRLADLVFFTSISLIAGGLIFKKAVVPGIMQQLAIAEETITNLAKLAGVKSQEYTGAKEIEKLVGAALLQDKFPEWEAIKLALPQETVDKIESSIEANPQIAVQLYDKYGHLFKGQNAANAELEYNF